MFAVNFGEVGFLATIDPDGVGDDFDRAFRGEFDTLAAADDHGRAPGRRAGRR